MQAPTLYLPSLGTSVAAAALMYFDLGLPPIPVYGVSEAGICQCGNPQCTARGKHPIGKQWQTRAPKTLDEVRDVFEGHFGNIGVLLQGTDRVLCDFDGPEGLETLAAMEAEGLLPPTLRARTGSGGAHLIYQLDSRHDPRAISDRRAGVKFDVKKHGQFVAAPSRHASGGRYEWTDIRPITKLTDKLFDRIRKPVQSVPMPKAESASERVARARAYVAKMPAAISGSGGHDATFSVARKLVADFELSEPDAWALLVEFNGRCQPPWSEKDLQHKLASAQRAHTRNPVQDRPRLQSVPGGRADAPPDEPQPADIDWLPELLWGESRTGKQKLISHSENVIRILQLHPLWKGKIRKDEFRDRIIVVDPPWDRYQRPHSAEQTWADEDATRLQAWLRREFHRYQFDPSITECERSVDVVAAANGWHPVRQYLDGLVWDQTVRLPRFAATYLGAEQSAYTTNVTMWWLTSAVARIYEPGCKADHVLILEGNQGIGKSSILRALAGEWFSDTPIDLNSKDAYAQIRGKWMVELAELDSLFKAESSRAKAFFSSPKDDYRPAYARREREQLRQCVFAGTVNGDKYLSDPTGNRRFWPVACGKLDLAALKRDRDQLWAEVVWRYRNGGRWWPEAEETKANEAEQDERTAADPWAEDLLAWIRRTGVQEATTGDLLTKALELSTKDKNRAAEIRVGIVMVRELKWTKHRLKVGETRVYAYRAPNLGSNRGNTE